MGWGVLFPSLSCHGSWLWFSIQSQVHTCPLRPFTIMPHSPGFLGKHLGQDSAPKDTACAERRKGRKPMREMAASPLQMWGSARMPSLRNRSEAAPAVQSQADVPLSLRFLNHRKTSTSHLFLSPRHTNTRYPSGASTSALQTPLTFTEAMPGPGVGGENDHLASITSELCCTRSTVPVGCYFGHILTLSCHSHGSEPE